MTTASEVDYAFENYYNVCTRYLKERGWNVKDDDLCEKGFIGGGTLTWEEAFWWEKDLEGVSAIESGDVLEVPVEAYASADAFYNWIQEVKTDD